MASCWNTGIVAFGVNRHNYCLLPLVRKLLLRHSGIEGVFLSTHPNVAKHPFVIQPGMSNQTGLVGPSFVKALNITATDKNVRET